MLYCIFVFLFVCTVFIGEHLYNIGINIKNNYFVLYKPELPLYITGQL